MNCWGKYERILVTLHHTGTLFFSKAIFCAFLSVALTTSTECACTCTSMCSACPWSPCLLWASRSSSHCAVNSVRLCGKNEFCHVTPNIQPCLFHCSYKTYLSWLNAVILYSSTLRDACSGRVECDLSPVYQYLTYTSGGVKCVCVCVAAG